MPRTKQTRWTYSCDALDDHPNLDVAFLEVSKGERCNTARGTEVHDQADADAHARALGWQITSAGRQTFCPACTGKGADRG